MMDLLLPVSLMVLGMTVVAAVSALVYVRLPKVLCRTVPHGRYFGLGPHDHSGGRPVGNSPIRHTDVIGRIGMLGQPA
ncbi:MAG: hypothetical protein JWN43_842 [Gammaproteobacteria bacterium]|nr:hypothetical protein [Gammaproteobacteria bacterium]